MLITRFTLRELSLENVLWFHIDLENLVLWQNMIGNRYFLYDFVILWVSQCRIYDVLTLIENFLIFFSLFSYFELLSDSFKDFLHSLSKEFTKSKPRLDILEWNNLLDEHRKPKLEAFISIDQIWNRSFASLSFSVLLEKHMKRFKRHLIG